MIFLLTLAALCYLIPFYFPIAWPLIWLFPSFLLHLSFYKTLSPKAIIIWSVTVTTFHLLPLCNSLIAMAAGPFLFKLVAPFLLILYVSLYPIAWLMITSALLRSVSSFSLFLFLWTIFFWLYLLVLEYALLWPFGRCEGYLFINPLLPLAFVPHLLAPLHYASMPFVLLWFCCIISTMYGVYVSSHTMYKLILLALSVPWVIVTLHTPTELPPDWLNTVGHLPLSFPYSISVESGQKVIFHELNQLYQNNSSLALIVMPESSWNNALLTHQKKLEWLINHPIKNIIMGSFAEDKKQNYNCLYWYNNGIQSRRHDKRHAIPLTERITLNALTFCTTLYFQKSPPVSPSPKPRHLLKIPHITTFMPYICSELYCNTSPDDPTYYPLLVTSNDSWFMPHFQKLMALAGRLRGIQWNRSILYISFHYAQFFSQWGDSFTIATTPPNRFIR